MKYPLAVLAVVLLFGNSGKATAQQAKAAPNFRDMFIQLDQNQDTVLERSEIPESGREAFDRLVKRGDLDKDGKLSAEEMRLLGQKMQVMADPTAVTARFKGMDKDNNGKVTKQEWTGVVMNFEKIDSDKDGTISEPELMAFSLGRKPETTTDPKKADDSKPKTESPKTKVVASASGPRFKELDKNSDGKLSKEEFPRPKIFERLDTDNDGYLSVEELSKLKKAE